METVTHSTGDTSGFHISLPSVVCYPRFYQRETEARPLCGRLDIKTQCLILFPLKMGSTSLLLESRLAWVCFYFPCGSAGKESACNVSDLGSIPGRKIPWRKGKATHPSILAWRIPWTVLLLLLLSHFSRVRLCATPQMAAHQAPPSLGFSR